MKSIYIVYGVVEYESESILGLFSYKEDAEKLKKFYEKEKEKRAPWYDYIEIEKYEDGETRYLTKEEYFEIFGKERNY